MTAKPLASPLSGAGERELVTAVVAVKIRPKHQLHRQTQPPASYGVSITGAGGVATWWGAAKTTNQNPLIASAVLRLLRVYEPEGCGIVVHANVGLWDQIAPHCGHIRYSIANRGLRRNGQRYQDFDLIRAVAEAHDAGGWTLKPFRKGEEPPGYSLAEMAAMKGLALALPGQWDLARSDLGGVFETDEGIDPTLFA